MGNRRLEFALRPERLQSSRGTGPPRTQDSHFAKRATEAPGGRPGLHWPVSTGKLQNFPWECNLPVRVGLETTTLPWGQSSVVPAPAVNPLHPLNQAFNQTALQPLGHPIKLALWLPAPTSNQVQVHLGHYLMSGFPWQPDRLWAWPSPAVAGLPLALPPSFLPSQASCPALAPVMGAASSTQHPLPQLRGRLRQCGARGEVWTPAFSWAGWSHQYGFGHMVA